MLYKTSYGLAGYGRSGLKCYGDRTAVVRFMRSAWGDARKPGGALIYTDTEQHPHGWCSYHKFAIWLPQDLREVAVRCAKYRATAVHPPYHCSTIFYAPKTRKNRKSPHDNRKVTVRRPHRDLAILLATWLRRSSFWKKFNVKLKKIARFAMPLWQAKTNLCRGSYNMVKSCSRIRELLKSIELSKLREDQKMLASAESMNHLKPLLKTELERYYTRKCSGEISNLRALKSIVCSKKNSVWKPKCNGCLSKMNK